MRYHQFAQQNLRRHQPKRSWRERLALKKRAAILRDSALVPKHQTDHQQKKLNRPERRYKLFLIIFLVVVAAWLITLLSLSFFRISNINVNGDLVLLNNKELHTAAGDTIEPHWWWPSNNYFLVNPNKIADILKQKFSIIGTLEVNKIFPNTLAVKVTEKNISIILDTRKELFLVDEAGVAVKKLDAIYNVNDLKAPTTDFYSTSTQTTSSAAATGIQGAATSSLRQSAYLPPFDVYKQKYGNYLVVYDDREKDMPENALAIKPEILRNIMAMQQSAQSGLGLYSNFAIIHAGGREGAELYTGKPWHILFDPNQDITPQVFNLKAITQSQKPTSYIDLRFTGRVYWK